MRIWTVRFNVRCFASSVLIDKSNNVLEFIPDWPSFEGQCLKESWITPRIRINKNKPIGNFTDVDPGVLVCDSFALTRLKDNLEGEVEILPIETSNGIEMHALNVINLVDCLDESNSRIEYFESGRIMDIQTYAFFMSDLRNTMLFKIPQFSRTEIFATDFFRDKVLESSLTGLMFSKVYDE